jgi:anaerobic selenocysteine-containing dehydrogenase
LFVVSLSRRNFIKSGLLTGAAVGLTACQRNVEHKLVSQYQMPEYKLPGQNIYFATNCGECSGGCGVAIKTNDGRAIKMEGIPEHPLSKGRLCARGQSGLQALYHPNRLNGFFGSGGQRQDQMGWEQAVNTFLKKDTLKDMGALFAVRGLRGSVGGQIVELAKEVGAKIWVVDYPSRLAERQVMKALTGKAELAHYPLETADYVVTFGGDFLGQGHNVVLANWAYGEFRQGKNRERGTMVSFSSRINQTAANADKWIPCKPGTEGWVALAIGNILAGKGKGGGWPGWARSVSLEQAAEASGVEAALIERVAARLLQAKSPLAIADCDAGNYINGVESLFAIHSLNRALRGRNETFEPENIVGAGSVPGGMLINTQQAWSLLNGDKVAAMWVFDVDLLQILPAALKPEETLKKAGNITAFATFANETTKMAQTVVPIQHWLEDWGDQRVTGPGMEAYNVQQPVVTSVFANARSLGDILASVRSGSGVGLGVLPKDAAAPAAGAQNQTIRGLIQGKADATRWETMLARGGSWKADSLAWEVYPNRVQNPPPPLEDPGTPPAGVNPYESLAPARVSSWTTAVPALRPDHKVLSPFPTLQLRDGSLANRPWMAELPDPITTVVWGGWVEINDQWAREKGISRHDVVVVTLPGGVSFKAPALPLPSVHPDAVAIPVWDEAPDYSKWSDPDFVDFGMGNKVFGRYGYTNAGYGRGGVNPLKHVPATMTAAGEPQWLGAQVTVERDPEQKVDMIIAQDLRVFNMPRELVPFE